MFRRLSNDLGMGGAIYVRKSADVNDFRAKAPGKRTVDFTL
jgi:hypothetical protein